MLKKFIKFAQENSLFLLVIVLAAAFRFVVIEANPPSLNWDEVSHGYNAYSILKTGKDEWGKTFPIIFRAYGDYKLPIYIYITAISEFFFGLNTFAVRLPSVLAGIGTVIFTYLLVRKLFNLQVALLSSLLVAIEPWTFFLSRGAFEANLALAFIVIGIYFFLKSFQTTYYLLLTTFFLGLSVWTYNSARVFVPFFLLVLVLTYKKEISQIWKTNKKLMTYNLLLIALFFLPMFWQLLNPVGQARYGRVAILDEGAIAQINESRAASGLHPILSRLLYNKATYFTSKFVRNWVSNYSGDFLFFKGGSNFQFSVPNHGVLYMVNLVFLLLGVVFLLRKRTRESFLILVWFFLGSIPGSLTREAPHVLRAITLLPAPMIIVSFGFVSVFDWLKNKKIGIPLRDVILYGYIIILAASLESYLGRYFGEYRSGYSWSWQFGYKEVVDYVRQHYGSYDKIIVSKKYGEPHEFFLFFWPWDPKSYQNDPNLIRFYQSNWCWVDKFDKFYFVNDWQIPRQQNESFVLESGGKVECLPRDEALRGQMSNVKCLLITSPGNYPDGWEKLETINFLDGRPAFDILEN